MGARARRGRRWRARGLGRAAAGSRCDDRGPAISRTMGRVTLDARHLKAAVAALCLACSPEVEDDGTISCSYGGDMCRQARGTTPEGVKQLAAWCFDQSEPTYREEACPSEGLVGGCHKAYDGVEEIFWSYGMFGKTTEMVQKACEASGTKFVPPPEEP